MATGVKIDSMLQNIVNSNKNIMNHRRQGQVCTSGEDLLSQFGFRLSIQKPQTGDKNGLD